MEFRGVGRQAEAVYHTSLFVYYLLEIHVDRHNDDVGKDVESSDTVENVRVVKRDFLRHLHHETFGSSGGYPVRKLIMQETSSTHRMITTFVLGSF